MLNRLYPFFFAAVLSIAAFNLFYHLGDIVVADWDEARQGVNAAEMVQSGNWIFSTYMNQPDYWNTKPPLGFWAIAVSYKIFGISPFSLRVPAALFSLLGIYFIMLFTRKRFGDIPALLTGFILATSINYIYYHAGKSGDLDSGQAFFYILSLYFLDRSREKPSSIFLTGLFAACAFLNKSFAVLPLLVIIPLTVWAQNSWKQYKLKDYLLFFTALILPVLAWVIARYQQDGFTFFKAMIQNDIVERTAKVLPGQPKGNLLTFPNAIITAMIPWSLFLPFVIFYKNKISIGNSSRGLDLKIILNGWDKTPLIWIWLIVYLGMFSFSTTKLFWYMVPVLPSAAILIADSVASMIKKGEMPNLFFRFFRYTALPLTVIFLIAAEAQYIWPGRYTFSPEQNLIKSIPVSSYKPETVFYFTDKLTQSREFMTHAVQHFSPAVMGREDYAVKAPADSFILLPNQPDILKWAEDNKIKITVQNKDWIIFQKGFKTAS